MEPPRWRLELTNPAQRELGRLPAKMRRRILVALQGLLTIPRIGDIKKIAGSVAEYRLRVGDYRVLFDVDQESETITVTAVRHRSSAYER